MKHTLTLAALLTALLLAPLAALHAAEASPDLLRERGLPRILFNNDSDDLKFPAYPEHHADGVWVPEGNPSILLITADDIRLQSNKT